jgi:hypothetical protein
LTNSELEKIEKKIHQIQKSTRTLLPFFIRPHNWLRSRLRWYYNWHLWRFASITHFVLLAASVSAILFGVWSSLGNIAKTEHTFASGSSYIFSGAGDSSYDGTYTESGTYNGRPAYTNGSKWLFNDWCEGPLANDWVLGDAKQDIFAPFVSPMAYYAGVINPGVDTSILDSWHSAHVGYPSDYMPPAPTVTLVSVVSVPDPPTIGSVSAGDGQATVSFSPPGSDGGATITSYTVTSIPSGHSGSAASSPIIISGLTNGTSYTFTVHATNSVGNSPESVASNSVSPSTPITQPVVADDSVDHLTLNTTTVTLGLEKRYQFTAKAYTSSGVLLANKSFGWTASASAGTISSNGLFTAGTNPGSYQNAVVASLGTLKSYASVVIRNDSGATVTTEIPAPEVEPEKVVEIVPSSVQNQTPKTESQLDVIAKNIPLKIAILAIAAASSVVAAGISFIGAAATGMSLKDILLVFSNYIMAFFAARRKDKMGLVFDQLTGKPVEKAVVELFGYEEMKLVGTALSDKKGHFFFVVKPGEYVISILKPGYLYPSVHIKDRTNTNDNYIGQVITIENGSGAINASVPIDPIANGVDLKYRPLISLMRSKVLRYLFSIIGSLMAVYSLVTTPDETNFIIAGIFVILWALEFNIINRGLRFSTVIDRVTGKPISLALVRLQTINGHFSESFISDEDGKVLPRSQTKADKLIIEKFGYKTIEHQIDSTGFIERQRFHMQKDENNGEK